MRIDCRRLHEHMSNGRNETKSQNLGHMMMERPKGKGLHKVNTDELMEDDEHVTPEEIAKN